MKILPYVLFVLVSFTAFAYRTTPPPITPVAVVTATSPSPLLESKTASFITASRLNLQGSNLVFLTDVVNTTSADIIINTMSFYPLNAPVYMVLNSPGGSVLDGARIIAAMEGRDIRCVVTDLAASMAFHIFQHCSQRYMTRNSFIMAHPASLSVMYSGELDKFVSRYSFLKHYVDRMDLHAANRAGMTLDHFKLLTGQELWLDAQESVERKFADKVVIVNLPSIAELGPKNNKIKDSMRLE